MRLDRMARSRRWPASAPRGYFDARRRTQRRAPEVPACWRIGSGGLLRACRGMREARSSPRRRSRVAILPQVVSRGCRRLDAARCFRVSSLAVRAGARSRPGRGSLPAEEPPTRDKASTAALQPRVGGFQNLCGECETWQALRRIAPGQERSSRAGGTWKQCSRKKHRRRKLHRRVWRSIGGTSGGPRVAHNARRFALVQPRHRG